MRSFNKLHRRQKPITANRMRMQFKHQLLIRHLGIIINQLHLKVIINSNSGIGRDGIQVNPFAYGFVCLRLLVGHSFLAATTTLIIIVLLLLIATVGTHNNNNRKKARRKKERNNNNMFGVCVRMRILFGCRFADIFKEDYYFCMMAN